MRALPARALPVVPGRPRRAATPVWWPTCSPSANDERPLPPTRIDRRPTLAVWKFASCDGCQLSLLDCEDELLSLAGAVRIAHFTEMSRATVSGPYDVSLVEGSITTPDDARRIQEVRANSRRLITIGACATAGGIQGLRNFAASGEYAGTVYAHPEYITSLDTSTPISAHVEVDFELHGCPIDRHQLLEVLTASLAGRRPVIPGHSVCQECKGRGTVCLLVAEGIACLGPVTRAGCGALCPTVGRGCFGCFGPADTANTSSLAAQLRRQGHGAGRRVTPLPHVQRRGARVPRRVRGPGRFPSRSHPGGSRSAAAASEELVSHGSGSVAHHRRRGPVAGRGRGIAAGGGARRRGHRRRPRDLRTAPVLRGPAGGPPLHRGPRHHGPHLRHLPGGLPDERVCRHGGRLWRDGRRGRSVAAAAPLLRGVDPEPRPAHLPAARPRLPRLRRRRGARRASTGRRWSGASRSSGRATWSWRPWAAGPCTRSTSGSAASTGLPIRRRWPPWPSPCAGPGTTRWPRSSGWRASTSPTCRATTASWRCATATATPSSAAGPASSDGLDVSPAELADLVVEEHVARSTALHARLGGRDPYLTGPLARYALNAGTLPPSPPRPRHGAGLGPVCTNPFRSIVVRAVELVFACEEALSLVESYDPPDPPAVRRRTTTRRRAPVPPRHLGACCSTSTRSTARAPSAGPASCRRPRRTSSPSRRTCAAWPRTASSSATTSCSGDASRRSATTTRASRAPPTSST